MFCSIDLKRLVLFFTSFLFFSSLKAGHFSSEQGLIESFDRNTYKGPFLKKLLSRSFYIAYDLDEDSLYFEIDPTYTGLYPSKNFLIHLKPVDDQSFKSQLFSVDLIPTSDQQSFIQANVRAFNNVSKKMVQQKKVVHDRQLAMILNLILGDAAGITYEYFEGVSLDSKKLLTGNKNKKPRPASGLLALAIKGRLHDQHILPKRLRLQGGGYFGAGAGEFSDDTSLALALMHALVDSDFQPSQFTREYEKELISWYRDKKYTCPSTQNAIGQMTKSKLKDVLKSSKTPFKESSNLTNGHIMCASPLACIPDLKKSLELADLKTGYFQKDKKVKDLTKIFVHFLHDLIFNEEDRPKSPKEIIPFFIQLCDSHYSQSEVGKFLATMCESILYLNRSSFKELRELKWADRSGDGVEKKKQKAKVYYVEFVRSYHAPLEKSVVYWTDQEFKNALKAYNNGHQSAAFEKMWFRALPTPYNVGGYGKHEFAFFEDLGITTKYDLGWVLGSSGSGVSCLISALFAVAYSNSAQEAILNAISLFGDTDTVAAIAGQIAGAYYGTVAANIAPVLKYRPNLIKEIEAFLHQDNI